MLKFRIISQYIARIYLQNFLVMLGIFIFLFTTIDVFSSGKSVSFLDIGLAFLHGIIQLDGIFPFIFLFSTIITLVKFKQTSQDIALISLDNSPGSILNKIAGISIGLYIFYCLFLHTIAFYTAKNLEGKRNNHLHCLGEVGSKTGQKNTIILNKIQYNICKDSPVINDVEVRLDGKNRDMQVTFLVNNVYQTHNIASNSLEKSSKQPRGLAEIKEIDRIERHKADISKNNAPLYYVISSIIKDNIGILHSSDFIETLLQKVKNAMLIYVYIYLCYFVLISHKRSFTTTKRIVNTLIFALIYYIISYLIAEKVKFADSIILQILGFVGMHGFLIVILKHIQHKCFLTMAECTAEIKEIVYFLKKYLHFIKKYNK